MKDRTTSLQGRLSLRLTTLFVLMFVAGMVMLSTRYRADSVELHAERLDGAIAAIAAGLAKNAAGVVTFAQPEGLDIQDYVVRAPDGQILASSSPAAEARLTTPPTEWQQGVYTDAGSNGDGQDVLMGALGTLLGLKIDHFAQAAAALDELAKVFGVFKVRHQIPTHARPQLPPLFPPEDRRSRTTRADHQPQAG
jgi:hypothetical protein